MQGVRGQGNGREREGQLYRGGPNSPKSQGVGPRTVRMDGGYRSWYSFLDGDMSCIQSKPIRVSLSQPPTTDG